MALQNIIIVLPPGGFADIIGIAGDDGVKIGSIALRAERISGY
jgi:hypothetical protein